MSVIPHPTLKTKRYPITTKNQVILWIHLLKENNFKGFAPYLSGNHVDSLNEEWHEVWEPYPFFKGCGKNVSYQDVNEWAKKNRKILWNNHI